MNTPLLFGIESFLNVLSQLISSGEWSPVCDGVRIRLKRSGEPDMLWTPLTAVIFKLRLLRVKPEDRLRTVLQNYLTTSDQIQRIIDAEDGCEGFSGFDRRLRDRIEELAQAPRAT